MTEFVVIISRKGYPIFYRDDGDSIADVADRIDTEINSDEVVMAIMPSSLVADVGSAMVRELNLKLNPITFFKTEAGLGPEAKPQFDTYTELLWQALPGVGGILREDGKTLVAQFARAERPIQAFNDQVQVMEALIAWFGGMANGINEAKTKLETVRGQVIEVHREQAEQRGKGTH
jgi:hypothetical protein